MTAPDNSSNTRRIWARCCVRIAWISGVFSLVLGGVLLFNSVRLYRGPGNGKVRLVEALELAPLKKQLREDPKNEPLKQRIRELDRDLRHEYFRREALGSRAGWSLLAGSLVFLTSMHLARTLGSPSPRMPAIPPRMHHGPVKPVVAARAVAGTTLALAGVATSFLWNASPRWDDMPEPPGLTESPDTPAATEAGAQWFPSAEEIAANWPYFRGPESSGITRHKDIPETWDAEAGTNLLWKAEIALPGENSPIVWDDRVFLTCADEKEREVRAYSTADGKLLWKLAVGTPQSSRAEPPEVMEDTGHAAPTAATDGKRVFAVFSNGDLTGVTAAGKSLWTRSLGTPVNMYGHSSSLLLWHNRVIVLFDQGEAEDEKSRIMAFDCQTGEPVWSTPRPVPNSWASPILIRHDDREQIITTADPWVISYDPESGRELWRAECMKGDIAASPVFANGLVYVASDQSSIFAIKPDGSGNVTETHIAWQNGDKGLPDTCSMFCDGPRVYTLSFGVFHAFDALTGKHLWSHETGIKFEASPSLANGRIHLTGTEGITIIGEADNNGFKETGRSKTGEDLGASPAFAPGRIYLRSHKHLFCIGTTNGK
jgi:outer membrane protein assembly factor BamB